MIQELYLIVVKIDTFIQQNGIMLYESTGDIMSEKEKIETILKGMKYNDRLNSLWNKYTIKRKYAKNIQFSSIIELLNDFLDKHLIMIHN